LFTLYEHTKFWSQKLKGRDKLEELGADGMIVLLRNVGILPYYYKVS